MQVTTSTVAITTLDMSILSRTVKSVKWNPENNICRDCIAQVFPITPSITKFTPIINTGIAPPVLSAAQILSNKWQHQMSTIPKHLT
ncbi:hypothetical protein CU097_003364 [Rhizopus azygosporus]|uniref:Uncharacterized protein n=1 Tax=Rhizopus azygosporus TaxID=86630 RepID=A0A367JMB6_RHIAZ|nr:hypothetical protein CU097_003364 [Rhizopus azygosporus]